LQKSLIKASNLIRFLEYGFKPEQLWTIQHQVFNRALSIAQGVEAQVSRASFWSNIVEKVLWGISALSLFLGYDLLGSKSNCETFTSNWSSYQLVQL
jgi:hypothetical protein